MAIIYNAATAAHYLVPCHIAIGILKAVSI